MRRRPTPIRWPAASRTRRPSGSPDPVADRPGTDPRGRRGAATAAGRRQRWTDVMMRRRSYGWICLALLVLGPWRSRRFRPRGRDRGAASPSRSPSRRTRRSSSAARRIAAEVKISEPELLDRVEFLVGDDVIFVDREPPFECIHDFGDATRSQVVRAIAYHLEGGHRRGCGDHPQDPLHDRWSRSTA